MTPAVRRLVVFGAAVIGVAVTARLGLWQLDRAAQKTALQTALTNQQALPAIAQTDLALDARAAAAQHHRSIRLSGQWAAAKTVFLDNRPMNGRPGFYAITPLVLRDGTAVLVQRGWVARDMQDRQRIGVPPPPSGEVTVQGRIAPAPGRLYAFAAVESGPIRQNLDTEGFAREVGLPLRPLSVVLEDRGDPLADGLLRQWPEPAAGVHKHHGYAFQWFALSTLITCLYVWFQIVSPARQGRRPGHVPGSA